jgi:hypothetical protein
MLTSDAAIDTILISSISSDTLIHQECSTHFESGISSTKIEAATGSIRLPCVSESAAPY